MFTLLGRVLFWGLEFWNCRLSTVRCIQETRRTQRKVPLQLSCLVSTGASPRPYHARRGTCPSHRGHYHDPNLLRVYEQRQGYLVLPGERVESSTEVLSAHITPDVDIYLLSNSVLRPEMAQVRQHGQVRDNRDLCGRSETGDRLL